MQLTVNVPENKMAFFIELIESLGFMVDKNTDHSFPSQEQIDLAMIEHNKIQEDPSYCLDWEEARKTLKFA